MIIKITRSGGFAGGVEQLGTIDTSSLGAEAAAKVQARVAKLERLEGSRHGISRSGRTCSGTTSRSRTSRDGLAGSCSPMKAIRASRYPNPSASC